MKNERLAGRPPEYHHEENVPRLTAIFIIAGSVMFMIIVCLIITQIILHHYKQQRPMQPMQSLGVLTAPDNQPLKQFPTPNLELDDGHADLMALQQRQMDTLNTYGWIDRTNRIARIPIGRAMELIASRGLPFRTNSLLTGHLQLQIPPERTIQ